MQTPILHHEEAECVKDEEISALSKIEHGNTLHNQSINEALKEHAVNDEGWQLRELAAWLYRWAERFNEEFALQIETPAIRIDRIHVRTLGAYRRGRNGLGVPHEISVNMKHLERPPASLLATLLHELLHEWQALHGKAGKGNFHNHEFRLKAHSYGLQIDQKGRSLGITPGLFTMLLEQHGVDTSVLPPPQNVLVTNRTCGDSKMKKWSCACPKNIRAAVVELNIQCLDCGARFQRTDPLW